MNPVCWFNKILNKFLKSYSLRSQIMFSFALLTIFSVTAVGLTALRMNYRYLENEKRDQSMTMIMKYYQAQEQEISNMVVLAASRPSLAEHLMSNDETALEMYLQDLIKGMQHIDSISVCNAAGQLTASTDPEAIITNCDLQVNPIYSIIYQEGTPQAWLFRGRKIQFENQTVGTVVLGVHLDNAFLIEMCDTCNLYHTLMHEGQVIATSFGGEYTKKSSVHIMPAKLADEQFYETFSIQDHEYYVSYLPLNGNNLTVEIALDVTSIKRDQQQQELFLTIVILVVVLLSVLFGGFLAQCIQRPISELIKVTNPTKNLHLSKPIQVNTKLSEVVELSQVLEDSRTRIQEALTSLRAEKQWNDLLLKSITEGIIILEKQTIIFFSPGAEHITGYAENEVIHHTIDEVLQVTDSSENFLTLLPPVGEKLRKTFTLKDELKKILSIAHTKLPVIQQETPATVLVLRDVSEEEALNHLLGSFLGNIAHEFRTPLSALTASIEILLDEADDLSQAEMKELLRSIHLSTFNLENLIDNLLEGSNIETGRFKVSAQATEIRSVIKATVETMDPLLRKYGQSLRIKIPEQLPLVLMDARRISQVIINLLSNASKYGPTDAEITLSVSVLEQFVEVSIKDQGSGVPPEYRQKIFSGFGVQNTHNGVMQKGARLGLMVSNTIIKAHHGQIGVRENPGGGSDFWFTIPITGEE